MEKLFTNFTYIGQGIGFMLQLLAGGFAIGTTMGLLLSILRHGKVLAFLVDRFVSIIRGTPLILQLSFIYFSIPSICGVRLGTLAAGIVAFGVNSSAYVSEILRSGIESLPKGQFEAAQTLRIPKYYMWKDIILPQVITNVLPALINEIIALLKETAIIAVIGGMDVMRRSQIVAAEQFEYFAPLCIAGVYYYVLVLLIEFVGRKIEKRRSYAKNS
ncbi:MAG: amino acid ABC transporter permease [Holosporaceae bacterium]|jgi:polar amino acid transport system permease protein|nr:amino acid ABC transporter permease [Holosporaceae bacterium]